MGVYSACLLHDTAMTQPKVNFLESLRFSHLQKKGALLLTLPVLLVLAGFSIWNHTAVSSPGYPPPPDSFFESPLPQSTFTRLDMNLADSAAWDALPGIGPVLSARIIRYRERLGGFDSVGQIDKVYGLSGEVIAVFRDSLFAGPKPHKHQNRTSRPRISPIDINTAAEQDWVRLPGIGSVLSKRIMKYRKARGGFSSAEDLQKVYGLSQETFTRIRPFLQVSEEVVSNSANYSPIDINQAEASEWESLPGIGKKLADRIIRFRKKLGFFYSPEQIADVYGLGSETYQQIRPYLLVSNLSQYPRKSLRKATTQALQMLPTVDENSARAIVRAIRSQRTSLTWEYLENDSEISNHVLTEVKTYYHLPNPSDP